MSYWRWILWLLGPVLIFSTSLTLARWSDEANSALATNEVLPANHAGLGKRPVVILTSEELAHECRMLGLQWQRQLGPTCHVLCRPPFVLAGDLSDSQLEVWHRDYVLPTTDAMDRQYVATLPHEPVSILLFASPTSYDHYADRLFGERNVSVYGYYKPGRRTLLVSTETGGGTLVHELTHAMLAFDFPQVADWFNEGLASLHEQCRFRTDRPGIEGLENWRGELLATLHNEGRLRTLSELLRDDAFRGTRQAANYAHARYFCLFMQQRGVLARFYRLYRDQHARDPRGEQALVTAFDVEQLSEVDAMFRDWIDQRMSVEAD